MTCMRHRRLGGQVAAALAAVGLTLAGCSDQPEVCDDRAALEESVQTLRDVDISDEGLSALQDQLAQVGEDVDRLAGSAQEEFSPQIDAMEDALTSLRTSLEEATSDAESLGAVTSAVGDVDRAFGELDQAVSDTC